MKHSQGDGHTKGKQKGKKNCPLAAVPSSSFSRESELKVPQFLLAVWHTLKLIEAGRGVEHRHVGRKLTLRDRERGLVDVVLG